MKTKQISTHGFTIIELMVCIVIVSAISLLALVNIRSARSESRDSQKKSDINAVYFQLESFHESKGYYPNKLSTKTLKGIDPESLIDNNGKSINQAGGLYTYKPKDCADSKCKSYELKALLEKEAPYIKLSLIR